MTTADEVTRYTSWAPAVPEQATRRTPAIGRHRAELRAALNWRRMFYTARHARV